MTKQNKVEKQVFNYRGKYGNGHPLAKMFEKWMDEVGDKVDVISYQENTLVKDGVTTSRITITYEK